MWIELATKHESYLRLVQNKSYDQEKEGQELHLLSLQYQSSHESACWLMSHALYMQGIQEADRSSEGFYIRSGVTIILKNTVIPDGSVI